jgi:hypothetical protein
VRLVLDECLPRVFANDLPGHEVHTVQQAGFSGATNGELLKRIGAAGFNAFITVDKNLLQSNASPACHLGLLFSERDQIGIRTCVRWRAMFSTL